MKSAKNIQVLVIEKVILLGFLLVNISSNNKKDTNLRKKSYIFTLYSL